MTVTERDYVPARTPVTYSDTTPVAGCNRFRVAGPRPAWARYAVPGTEPRTPAAGALLWLGS